MHPFITALMFLTTLPVRPRAGAQPAPLGRAAPWFPLVGLLLGGLLTGAAAALGTLFPPLLAAVLLTALWAALTGGLHLDGLADCCDGLLAPVSAQRRLEIMKDPRMGSFAGIGLVLFLLLKVFALLSLPPGAGGWAALLLAPTLARWLVLWLALQPQARPAGLGAALAEGLQKPALLAAFLHVVLAAALGGWRGAAALLLGAAAAWLIQRTAQTRLGGITGDVMGLCIEMVELVTLLTFAARIPPL